MRKKERVTKLPKMILFDYGHTLVYEHGFDGVAAANAVLQYATSNPNNISAEEISKFSGEMFAMLGRVVRANEIEVHNHMFDRFVYEYLQIELPLTPNELEDIFWENASPYEPMENAGVLLDYLNTRGIRSGVISNIAFGGETLKKRIGRLFPNNKFEFVIASSEYMFRKPNKMIFELALRKAGLEAEDVWYCGDSLEFDVKGALNTGIFPVLYKSVKPCSYRAANAIQELDGDYITITDWAEMIELLENSREGEGMQ